MIQNLQVFKFKYNKIDNNILLYIMSEEQNKNNIDLEIFYHPSDTKTDVKEDVSLKGASTDFLQSNNMITRFFAFILGVLIIFLYLMRVLISLMGWFLILHHPHI